MVVGTVITAESFAGSLKRLKDSRKAKEYVPAGKQRGKHISGSAGAFSFNWTRHSMTLEVQRTLPSTGIASTVFPAETRSPTLTVVLHSEPKSTSTLEPNLMYPIRSPAATTSPACL